MSEIKIRKFNDEDLNLFIKWLNKDHVKKWYEQPESWIEEITKCNNNYQWINHFIVTNEDEPIGFCQYYDCFNAKDLEDWYEVKKPNTMFSIDYLIGEEQYLGKGYGKEIVKSITELIKKNHSGQIVVQPDKENLHSCKALLANGYVYDEKWKYYYLNI